MPHLSLFKGAAFDFSLRLRLFSFFQNRIYLDSNYPSVISFPMLARRPAFLPPRPSFLFSNLQTAHHPCLSAPFYFQQVTNRSLSHIDSYIPSFQEVTNPSSSKPFIFTIICIPGGVLPPPTFFPDSSLATRKAPATVRGRYTSPEKTHPHKARATLRRCSGQADRRRTCKTGIWR